MGFQLGQTSSGGVAPWVVGTGPLFQTLQRHLRSEAAVLGLIDLRDPEPGSFLAAEGSSAALLEQWCQKLHEADPLLREARRRGAAVGMTVADAPGPPLPANLHALVLVLPVSLEARRAWYLALGRSDAPFDEAEQRHAMQLLRALRAQFDHVVPPTLGRALLDERHHLLQADPFTEGWLLDQSAAADALREQFPAIVAQRWPNLVDAAAHDLALDLAGQSTWVRFMRMRPSAGHSGHYWSLEFRPLSEQDIPPVGLLDDPRVARAVAYLTDEFARSPSLGDVAEVVQTSPFHFHRLFVRQVGISPKHYLLRMQLMVAKWMLHATGRSIGDIASATGFASHGHFTATFHRIVGASPSNFRESG